MFPSAMDANCHSSSGLFVWSTSNLLPLQPKAYLSRLVWFAAGVVAMFASYFNGISSTQLRQQLLACFQYVIHLPVATVNADKQVTEQLSGQSLCCLQLLGPGHLAV